MKRSLFSFSVVYLFLVVNLTGCSYAKIPALVNTQAFDVDTLQGIHLDYAADDIHIRESKNEKLVLKEYMNKNKKKYHAKISVGNSGLRITEGERPLRPGFESYVELYIPQIYTGSLFLHSTSGTIDSNIPLHLSNDFSADATNGKLAVSNIKASTITITTTNGEVKGSELTASLLEIHGTNGLLNFANLDAQTIQIQTTNANTSIRDSKGAMIYTAKNGNLTASGILGSGSFEASGEGNIQISFNELTGNLTAYSKNGGLTLKVPEQFEFSFSATTKEGSIVTSFSDKLNVSDTKVVGIIGNSPVVSIALETRNGEIKVSK